MKTALIFTLLILSTSSFASSVYRYVDDKGRVSFSDQPRHDGYIPLVESTKGWVEITPPNNWKQGLIAYRPLIESAAFRHEISPELVSAVVHAESHFNPIAASSKGAIGLMQLMPGTAAEYRVTNRQDPRQSLEGGTRYLKDLLNLFNNDVELAVAAYNAGQNAIIENGYQVPQYEETQRYVKKVLALYKHYSNTNYNNNYVAAN